MYTPVDPKVSFPKMEEGVLEFWKQQRIFERSAEQRAGQEEFVFYDGPPFATGLPHFGHFVPGTIKDIIPRYQTMRGKHVERRFGWDCHGLPVEYEMEKSLGISGKREIEEYGVARFNEDCRGIVLRYTQEWERIVTRLGRWVDFQNDYKTMDPEYMESIWWVFQQLWEKDLIYEGYYILPYSPALTTALSNFEVNLGGYKDVNDPAITVAFQDRDAEDTYLLAWTTTPWTLPSNLALAVGSDITYVQVKDGDRRFILAESRLGHYYKEDELPQVEKRFTGAELVGRRYRPLFEYFVEQAGEAGFQVHAADFVTTENGTGIVHLAPGFGEDDYNALRETGLPVIVPIDADARFTEEVSDFAGMYVKDADKEIIRYLKDQGSLIRRENYLHSYPHCYRSGQPLIYRAISSWYVRVERIKEIMLQCNSGIHWMPEHLREGRFGKWLEGARDWAISRDRYWGNPIPVWRSDTTGHMECIGSIAELQQKCGVEVTDLHKHYVDDLTWQDPTDPSGVMRRVPAVLDCWFESGAMPYAQSHYPFENPEEFEANFPAHFIAEGLDQTRGWFYTLTVLAAALFEKPAFRNVIVNGLVLAEDGKKMSKSLRNYTDPEEVINKFGADALRLFLMNSAVVRAEDLKYSDEGVKEVLKNIIIPLWNSYSFFVTYANIDGVTPTGAPERPDNPLDEWILSYAEGLVEEMTTHLDNYDLQKAAAPLVRFIDQLNNWYIRRSRRRFWKSENDQDKEQAYGTLYAVLMKLITLAAPFIPFISDEIYRNLRTDEMPESVHLCDYPTAGTANRNQLLERKMAATQQAVSMGRAIRSMYNLKVRQPLKAVHLVTLNREEKNILREMEDIIREELNVKEVVFRENEEDLVEYQAKPNYRVLGKQLGKDMKTAAAKIQEFSGREIMSLMEGNVLNLDIADRSIDITIESIEVQRLEKENLKVLNEGSLTIALDPEITEELNREGMVRDLIRGVQNLRKESGLDVTDRIVLTIEPQPELQQAVADFEEFLQEETLCVEVCWDTPARAVTAGAGEITARFAIRKA
ncbi:isoleucine--tRNA ligase [Spirochaeta africana]|uniref:Isoleucine--tRNA ligase n=1 Tax=Spirochaeta africana (strain ATCC 700263 / DSM 8902 / Z-7692) TaxID=889378 RepID=H9ULW5_SPIAZ|nr:isoleucine--tRNA ligase [Spirochaeta africana]AFG38508.1 isoleucyl-tRNA synthetase [Spirochaeta africana DSM 8902]